MNGEPKLLRGDGSRVNVGLSREDGQVESRATIIVPAAPDGIVKVQMDKASARRVARELAKVAGRKDIGTLRAFLMSLPLVLAGDLAPANHWGTLIITLAMFATMTTILLVDRR